MLYLELITEDDQYPELSLFPLSPSGLGRDTYPPVVPWSPCEGTQHICVCFVHVTMATTATPTSATPPPPPHPPPAQRRINQRL